MKEVFVVKGIQHTGEVVYYTDDSWSYSVHLAKFFPSLAEAKQKIAILLQTKPSLQAAAFCIETWYISASENIDAPHKE